MGKQQKPKPAKVKPTEKTVSPAKQRRINRQTEQTTANAQLWSAHAKPWNEAKALRHKKRKLAGKTYESWRRANSARSQDGVPTASNLLTGV